MMILLALLSTLASAGAPTAQVETVSAGASTVTAGSVDSNGDLFVFTSANQVVALDVSTWSALTASPCTVTSATAVDGGDGAEVWVGCDTGEVRLMGIVDGSLVNLTNDGADIVLQSSQSSAITDEVAGLFHYVDPSGERSVYAIYDTSPVASLVQFDVQTLEAGATSTFFEAGYSAGAIGSQVLFVSHNSSRMSTVRLPLGTPQLSQGFYPIEVDNLAAAGGLSTHAFAVERGADAQVAVYDQLTNLFAPGPVIDSDIQAVGAPSSTDELWALFVYSDRVDVRPTVGGRVSGPTVDSSFAIEGAARHVVVGPAGYTAVGMTGGDLSVLTDRPWVSDLVVSVGGQEVFEIGEGDAVSVTAVSDQAGDWTIELGGTWDQPGSGEVLASGTLASAGPIEADFVADAWDEGENLLFVRVDAGNLEGHRGTGLLVDLAPAGVALSDSSVAYEDKTLTLSFTALETEDIKEYRVYVATEPFSASDYATGGPEFEGEDEIEAPLVVTEFEAGEAVSVDISPLTNDETYYLAVRATDTGGLEGAMSAVVEGRPRPTKTAAQLAGEEGGMDCSAVGGVAAWPLALVGLFGLRRRRGIFSVGALVAVGLLSSSVALAQDEPAPDSKDMPEDADSPFVFEDGNGDLTEAWASVEVRYGLYRGTDARIDAVYGNGAENESIASASSVMVEFGPQLYRVVEIDFGFGYMPRGGFTVDDDNKPSATVAKLAIVPLSASITPRLHIFDEQPVVPFASIGGDWWLFRERKGLAESDKKEILSGSKFGWHWELGLNFLLDVLDRRRASLLEAQSGINDSWLTLSYRRQVIESTGTGFNFSGNTLEAGLKLDF